LGTNIVFSSEKILALALKVHMGWITLLHSPRFLHVYKAHVEGFPNSMMLCISSLKLKYFLYYVNVKVVRKFMHLVDSYIFQSSRHM
jgi:hypothetical protein